ncbi:pre-mRNA splicing factor SYF1 [Glomus cerebriforme]|uniref:Pre-mRNA-splicing factor SYF1 n=1 Tax=Glomus cerebriforme TaxID=658196 RepID=A0A397T811_9GLOM|nr:pre-mRNA splicing factor SYF1 [Glomus cerebriforme]
MEVDDNLGFYMIEELDIPFEEEILRNPYTLKSWLRYIDHKSEQQLSHQIFVYERALKELPGSYKLWKEYLDLRREHVQELNPVKFEKEYLKVNNCFERALVLLHKMPRIWLDYCSFLMNQCRITKTRRIFDRALKALPITQHPRIWELYLKFARSVGGETAIRLYRRYLKLEPDRVEEYIDLLLSLSRYDEAAKRLAQTVNNDRFQSMFGKSNYQLWMELCDLICEHPHEIKSLKVEPIIRSGIRRFTDQVGRLWNSLANYWIKLGHFEKARDVFEEGISTVMTVRDFTQIFDTYAKAEETVIERKMEEAAERAEEGIDDPNADLELDLRLMRFEQLMDRRPFLVNDVLLRQNPNNVHEWEKRVALWKDNHTKVVETYTKAMRTIDPKKATGKFHELWVNFAKFYEQGGDIENARTIFEKATHVDFKHVNDLAALWCEYAEMELRLENYNKAIDVMGRATVPPRNPNVDFRDESLPVQSRVFKSIKLWSFYVDLEESIGTVESTRAVYDRILELKIANPQIIINYANFLEENKYYEESFKVYERGVELFNYPISFEIWNVYLTKFIGRYGGLKLERARDLFEQALEKCPPKYAKPLYLMYGKLEEDYGLARHAMRIYDRATRSVSDVDRSEMFNFYIAKASANFGVTYTREIYERAIEVLPDKEAKDMCLKYAELERKLGEIDRARALYAHASQFCDPRTVPSFWQTWHDFEVKHGNEDTFKEMLRIKRSVQAQYNTEVNFISAQILATRQAQQSGQVQSVPSNGTEIPASGISNAMQIAEHEAIQNKTNLPPVAKSMAFVPSSTQVNKENVSNPSNPDEITMDMDDDDL